MSEQMKVEFDDFMQDMYDEEELQYMDSGFVNALWLAFGQGWAASRQSLVVELSGGDVDKSAYEYKIAQQLIKLGVRVVDVDGRPYK